MIIDVSDFTSRPYKVPNQPESPDFAEFVEDKEIELATRYLLGWDLWELFNEAVNGSGALEDRFTDLLNGAFYEYAGINYKYEGWKNLVRPGIYADWMPNISSKLTNIGVVRNDSPQQSKLEEDQYPFSVGPWNRFVKLSGFNGTHGYNYRNTLYGFLKVNEATYPEWEYNCPPFRNRFDL